MPLLPRRLILLVLACAALLVAGCGSDSSKESEATSTPAAEATAGSNVTVQYVGTSFKNGRQFDASWDRGEPFSFQLGAGSVIPGWDQGVQGMKVGGRRQLVIPPDLAYGPQGSPPAIGPNETLVFVIDLVSVD